MSQTTFSEKLDRKSAIKEGESVEILGLTFFPITMRYYEEFLKCKEALLLRQATLPVKYVAKDFLSAIFDFESDNIIQHGIKTGIFERIIILLLMSLRIDVDAEEFYKHNIFVKKTQTGFILNHIKITQNGNEVKITPRDFSTKIRPLIAEQNGLELPSESENFDLIKDYEEVKKLKDGLKLKHNTVDLIASVAYLSHIRDKEIYMWTVREFENRYKAIDRDKRYMLCGQASMSGMISFKNGNPAPSWCYDALEEDLGSLSLSEVGKSLGNPTTEDK
jgi:hypothetical protein